MDIALNVADQYFFTPYVYSQNWPENDAVRQFISLNVITDVGGALIYLITATLNYLLIFDKRLLKHPQILENQIRREIVYTLKSVPFMGFPTSIVFLMEVRGYSRLYDNVGDSKFVAVADLSAVPPNRQLLAFCIWVTTIWEKIVCKRSWFGLAVSALLFILFTDCLIYWIHRGLHHRLVYSTIHKPHHTWKVPTPYASHAFHPIDGFLQSLPYHIYVFLFPMHKLLYLALYVFVNIWTVSIHDGNFRVPDILKPLINGAAHHTDHHLLYNYNYGQYFTLWDRIGGSFRCPSAFEGCGPMDHILKLEASSAKSKVDDRKLD